MTTVLAREAFGAEFVGADGFLNTPTYGLPPRFLVDALQDCITGWQAGTMDATSFDEPVRAGRAGYAALTGVPVDSVAMGGNVSAVLGLVAAAVPDGSRVASLVQSANGAVVDVDALRSAVAGTDTLTVIDVTQALGWKKIDVGWADVTAAGVYKWLLAPRGTAWMSLSDRVSQIVTPHAANWYAGEKPWQTIYGLPLRLADSARRFDTSPAWFSALGSGLTLPWLASLDGAAIEAHTVGLANVVRAELALPQQDSAIVSIPIADAAERLRLAAVRASVRAGAVRVGFHLYNTQNDLDRLLDALGDSW